MRNRIAAIVLVARALALLSHGTRARAQSVTATLVGTVFDSSGAAVPNAKLALTNNGTNVTIGDPLHVWAVKKSGATTREAAHRISQVRGYEDWHDPAFQSEVVRAIQSRAQAAGRRFAVGPAAFAWLAEMNHADQ